MHTPYAYSQPGHAVYISKGVRVCMYNVALSGIEFILQLL